MVIGMFGGKFIPFHNGHRYCLEVASSQCDTVYCIMFVNGKDEENIPLTDNQKKMRLDHFFNAVKDYKNVIPCVIDVSKCRTKDDKEDWDAETPLVRSIVGDRLDRIYSSEPSYGAYFHRAYPEAKHILVDPDRIKYPISGTKIRAMIKNGDESWKDHVTIR